ncbi:MAG: hypothetical protein JSU77_00625 [Fidelibacterota bacterium]|nr:MAG: hypothetical protein JSU77_00625 [Candidatus Neomarinimicrobiota bacterium]
MARHHNNRIKLLNGILWPVVCFGFLWAQGPTPDPRSLGLAGATTSLVEGIHAVGYNPARLAFSANDFSMNLGGLTFGLENNLLSIENYNLINGADFIDTLSNEYVNKQTFLEGIPYDGLRINTSMHLPIPGINWARGITAFSSEIVIFGDMGLPKAMFDLLMQGNVVGDSLKLTLNEELTGAAEWGFSFAVPTGDAAIGFTLKYLQGLFHIGVDQDSSSGYFLTDTTGFKGEGRYLLRQAVGGSGFGLDIGFATSEINGYRLGISLINALGSIRWHGPSITKDLLGDALQGFMPWRENEYFLYTYRMNDVTGMKFLQDVPMDSLFQSETYTVVDTKEGLVRSDTLEGEAYQELSKEANLKPFITNYPALFRLGASKRVEGFGLLTLDLVTGFQDQLWASRGWQLAVGVEILRTPSFPIRMGIRYSGLDKQQLGLGFGIHKGPFQFDMAMAFHNGLWLHTTKGISLAFGFTLVR